MTLLSPLRYPGGKSKAINKILPYIIHSYEEYREPMVGGGSLFLKLKHDYPEKKYVINDLNYDLYSFWNQLKCNHNELIDEIINIKLNYKDGKILYRHLKNNDDFDSEFLKAIRFYVLNRITYSGTVDSGGYSKKAFKRRFTMSRINDLYSIVNMLNNVTITCTDYSYWLNKKGKKVLIYLDPPYINSINSRLYGKHGELQKNFNHLDFVKNVKKCEHNCLITLNDNEDIRRMFSYANFYPIKLQYGMTNTQGNKPRKGKEVIITNYLPFRISPVKHIPKIKLKKFLFYNSILVQFLSQNYDCAKLNINLKSKYYVKNRLQCIISKHDKYKNIKIFAMHGNIYLKKINK